MTFACRADKIRDYWQDTYGDGPAAHMCTALSVVLLAVLYAVGLVWMVPASIVRAYR